MLNDGHHRNHKEPTRKAEESNHNAECAEGPRTRGQRNGNRRESSRTQRYQSIFDFAGGEITGCKTADADTDADCGLQVSSLVLPDLKNVVPIILDGELQQRSQHEKVR